MKSIKSKILTVVILGLFAITSVVSVIAVNMTHTVMHKDADRILNNVTLKEAALINDALGDITKSTAVMKHLAISELESIDRLQDPEFLAKYLEKTSNYFAEIALNTNGAEGFFFRLNPEYTNSTTGFYYLKEHDSIITPMPLTDLSKYPKDDVRNVGWYYASIDEGGPVWLDPYYFPGHDNQIISYTIPLYVNSVLLGVIGFDMDFSYLTAKIDEISVYDEGYASLISKDGKTNYNQTNRDGEDSLHTKSSATLLNGMTLELRADYKDIQKDIHPMLSKIVLAFVIVLVLSIIYTIIVTLKIVKPLNQLTSVVKELGESISEEQLSRFPVDSNDEIGTLSKAIKSTYEKIQEYTAYINMLAYRDSLTGIKNSTAYTEAISRINKDIECSACLFGVVVADINNLKQTNDKFGHDIGNDLIIHTAKIISSIFKTSSCFRIGGDEFVVIVQGKDLENYRALLSRLDKECQEDFITVCENRISISLARGFALYDADIDRVYQDVFAKADHAMYLNKNEIKATNI